MWACCYGVIDVLAGFSEKEFCSAEISIRQYVFSLYLLKPSLACSGFGSLHFVAYMQLFINMVNM